MSVAKVTQNRNVASTGRIELVIDLFPDSAAIEGGELVLGGVTATELVRSFGSPLLVYDEATLRADARAYREAAPEAWIAYGTKAFPNLAILRLLAAEGIAADVSTLGELAYAERAGIDPGLIVVHGNNKSDEELAAAGANGSLVVLDSLEEIDRARAAGVVRMLIRVTPGIEADTHEAIRTAHHGSKFGVTPEDALEAIRRAPELEGLHVHIGSQLLDTAAALATVDWVVDFALQARAATGWEPVIIDLGGGLGVPTAPGEPRLSIAEFLGALIDRLEEECTDKGVARPMLILEPGRSLVGRAGVTLYTVGAVKRVGADTTYVAVDGGMSDNPRPALYGAQYTALLANRADERATGLYAVAGMHCESGDELIESVKLPEPRRGDILAVPATGGYTLAMSSNYNAVTRPAAVLVRDGEATLIRRRETLDDLFSLEP